MYTHEIDKFLNDVIINVESPIVLKNIMEMLKIANYIPNDQIFLKAISAYLITLDGLQQFDKFENND